MGGGGVRVGVVGECEGPDGERGETAMGKWMEKSQGVGGGWEWVEDHGSGLARGGG